MSMLRLLKIANSEENRRLMQAIFLTPKWIQTKDYDEINFFNEVSVCEEEELIKKNLLNELYEYCYGDAYPIKYLIELLSHRPLIYNESLSQQDCSSQARIEKIWNNHCQKNYLKKDDKEHSGLSWTIFLGKIDNEFEELCSMVLGEIETGETLTSEYLIQIKKDKKKTISEKINLTLPNEKYKTKHIKQIEEKQKEELRQKIAYLGLDNIAYQILDNTLFTSLKLLKSSKHPIKPEYQEKIKQSLGNIIKNCLCVINSYLGFDLENRFKYGRSFHFFVDFIHNLTQASQKARKNTALETLKSVLCNEFEKDSKAEKNQKEMSMLFLKNESPKYAEDNTNTEEDNDLEFNNLVGANIGGKKDKYLKILQQICDVKIDFMKNSREETYCTQKTECNCIISYITIINRILLDLREIITTEKQNCLKEDEKEEQLDNEKFLNLLLKAIRKLVYFVYTDNNPQIHEVYSWDFISFYYLFYFSKDYINSLKYLDKNESEIIMMEESADNDKMKFDPKSISAKILVYLNNYTDIKKRHTSLLYEQFIRSDDKSFTSLDKRYYGLFLHQVLLRNPTLEGFENMSTLDSSKFVFEKLFSDKFLKKFKSHEKAENSKNKAEENFAEFLFSLLNTCGEDFDEAALILNRVISGENDFFTILSRSKLFMDETDSEIKNKFNIRERLHIMADQLRKSFGDLLNEIKNGPDQYKENKYAENCVSFIKFFHQLVDNYKCRFQSYLDIDSPDEEEKSNGKKTEKGTDEKENLVDEPKEEEKKEEEKKEEEKKEE
ncbi:MAG: hypothetical protein MJ252_24120, partial [archaeon]|nr:hypothetical protein [archaeon]